MDKDNVIQVRDAIIRAALPHVPFEGWTWQTVTVSARQADLNPQAAQAVFPGSIGDVLDGFSDMADRAMLAALADRDPAAMRVRERIREAVSARFYYLQPYKEQMRLALAYWALPTRKPRAAKIVWRSADRIWDWAGDTATDYNRYTKRGLLSAILASSMLVWLGDETREMTVTKDFLDRRIDDVMRAGKFLAKFKARPERTAA